MNNNENEPLVSVIVPVYNTEKYIPRCLDSIINNSYKNLEIICIDDGSFDSSLSVLNNYQGIDSRIFVIHIANGGVSKARNEGLKKAKGKYIAFIDSDDWIHKHDFETLVSFQKKLDFDILCCEFYSVNDYIDDDIVELNQISIKAYQETEYLHDSYIKTYSWGRLYKTNIIQGLKFEEGIKRSEDRLFNHDCFCKNELLRIAVLDCKLYYYYSREDSAIHIHSIMPYYLYVCDALLQRVDSANDVRSKCILLSEAYRLAIVTRYISFHYISKEEKKQIILTIRKCIAMEHMHHPFNKFKAIIYNASARSQLFYRICILIRNNKLVNEFKALLS